MYTKSRSSMFIAGTVGLLLGASTVQVSASEEVTLRFAGQHPADHQGTRAIEAIAERIEEETDGRITFRLHPAGQLGDYTLIYDEVMRGTVDMALISAPAEHDARIEAQWLPYIAQDHAEAAEVFGEGSFLYDRMREFHGEVGVRFLGFFGEGFIGLGSTEMPDNAFEPAADKGQLVRVAPFRPAELLAESLGFRPNTLPYADTYSAVQTGVVDGWIGGSANLNYSAFRDVIDHFIAYNMFYEATSFFINEDRWESLSEEDREIIGAAVREYSEGSFEASREEDAEYLERLSDAGVEVTTLSDEELQLLAEHVRGDVWPRLEERFGSDFITEISEEFAR